VDRGGPSRSERLDPGQTLGHRLGPFNHVRHRLPSRIEALHQVRRLIIEDIVPLVHVRRLSLPKTPSDR